jgi:hypothetical protein
MTDPRPFTAVWNASSRGGSVHYFDEGMTVSRCGVGIRPRLDVLATPRSRTCRSCRHLLVVELLRSVNTTPDEKRGVS